MNRFAAHGLAIAARRGRTIVVVTRVVDEDAFDEVLATSTSDSVIAVRRANGAHRIDFASGGCIGFRSMRQGLRALSADTVYLDEGVDVEASLALHDDARRVVSTSPIGEVVRA